MSPLPHTSPPATTIERIASFPARRAGRALLFIVVAVALAVPAAGLAQSAVGPAQPAPGRIVYSRAEKNVFDLWTADPDGMNETRLVEIEMSPAGEDHPRFSPDGTRIVFETTSNTTPPRVSLWTVGFEGGTPVSLVSSIGVGGGTPDWSPDGRCIAYAGSPDGPSGTTTDLHILCDGEEPRRITNTPGINEQEAVWHPDGDSLAFVARTSDPENREDCWQLYEIDVETEAVAPLLELPGSACTRFPRWAPDGGSLALIITSNIGFDFGTLSLFVPSTGDLTQLVTKPSGPYSWSPDGTSLLFNNIALAGVEIVPGVDALPSDPEVARTTRALQEQGIGLYRLAIDGRRLSRLREKAGGNTCTGDRCFEFGYAPDWTAGTYTPTPLATNTPTVTPTPLATNTPTATATLEATSTPEATPTAPWIYLPMTMREHTAARPTPEPSAEASAEPSAEPTEMRESANE